MGASNQDIQNYIEEYRGKRPIYERYCEKLKDLLADILDSAQINFQNIEARAKTVESFAEKIQRPGKNYKNPLNEVSDLAALRIILYYVDDVEKIDNLVKDEFKIDNSRSVNKSDELAPDQFGYHSIHKVIQLSSAREKLLEWKPFLGLYGEIQIRTVLQHSWAAISHALQYKHKGDVPSQSQRKLVRISGLLELADEEFVTLRKEQISTQKTVAKEVVKGDLDIEINIISISEYVKKSTLVEKIAALAYEAGFTPISLHKSEDKGFSQLANACTLSELKSIEELDNFLHKIEPKAQEFFSKVHSEATISKSHAMAMLVAGAKLNHIPSLSIDKELGWSPGYSKKVIGIGKSLF